MVALFSVFLPGFVYVPLTLVLSPYGILVPVWPTDGVAVPQHSKGGTTYDRSSTIVHEKACPDAWASRRRNAAYDAPLFCLSRA